MKKKIVVGIYVCLFVLTITLSGVLIALSALNSNFLSPAKVYYIPSEIKIEILFDDYGYYVEMGEYPQTFAGYVTDITTLTDSGEEFTYVTKTGTTAIADVYIDSSGNRYIQYAVVAYSTDYTFVDGTATASGDAYFILEPIKWRVLGYYEDSSYTNAAVDSIASFVEIAEVSDDNYSALLAHGDAIVIQSELALEGVAWNITNSDVDYTGSTIYTWLNAFYLTALADYDPYISSRTIDYNDTGNASISEYDTVANTASEKIWLLSYTEVSEGLYYSDSTSRLCSPSDFALATYSYMGINISPNAPRTCFWWLRSSYLNNGYYSACNVNIVGDISTGYVNYDTTAVRPALLLNLPSTSTSTATTCVVSTAESMGFSSFNEVSLVKSSLNSETSILTTADIFEWCRFFCAWKVVKGSQVLKFEVREPLSKKRTLKREKPVFWGTLSC